MSFQETSETMFQSIVQATICIFLFTIKSIFMFTIKSKCNLTLKLSSLNNKINKLMEVLTFKFGLCQKMLTTYLLEMATTEKVLLLGTRSDLDFTDIDCNDRDAQLCTVYANDIYNNLRVAEVCGVLILFFLSTFFLSILHDFFPHGQCE